MDAFCQRRATSYHSIMPPITILFGANKLTRRTLSTFLLYAVATLIAFRQALLL